MMFWSYEEMVLGETGQYWAGLVTDEVHSEFVHYLSVGIPNLRVGLIINVAAQGVNGVLGGLGVPGFSIVELDSLSEGKPPPVGSHLFKASETGGGRIGKVRPKEGERLGHVLHYLVGVKGSTDPGIGEIRLFVDYYSDIVPAGGCFSGAGSRLQGGNWGRSGRAGWGRCFPWLRNSGVGRLWQRRGWSGCDATSNY
jgi:hypothetical protein